MTCHSASMLLMARIKYCKEVVDCMTLKTQLDSIGSVAQLLAALVVVAALYFGRDVLIPLTLAILLAFLLSPIVNRIQRLGANNIVAVLITALFTFLVMAVTLILVGREITTLVQDLPQYQKELVSKARGLAGLSSGMGDKLDELATEVTVAITQASEEKSSKSARSDEDDPSAESQKDVSLNPLQRLAANVFSSSTKATPAKHDGRTAKTPLYTEAVNVSNSTLSWAGTVGKILGPLGTVGLVTVFVLFLLVYRDDMRDRMIKVISRGNYVTTTEALNEVSERISRYLLAQTVVNVSYGLVLSLGLFIIGWSLTPNGQFPNFVLWGVLATLLRFVPYLGPVAAASFPLLISAAVFPGYSVTIAVLILIVVLELTSNNIIEPWLYSSSSGISAIAVIIAAVFWGWLWGPVGLLLSTPLTVCLVVLGRYVPRFRIFSTLLGEANDIKPWLRFYQRMLSKDATKAAELFTTHVKEQGGTKTIDELLVPTLRRLRVDQDDEHMTGREAGELMEAIKQLISQVDWAAGEKKPHESPPASEVASEVASEEASVANSEGDLAKASPPMDSPVLKIVGCTSHHLGEELLLQALAQAEQSMQFTIIGSNSLPDDIAKQATDKQPKAIVIVVLPTGGFTQARFLCRAIRKEKFAGTIIVCCCGKFQHFDHLFVKFRKAGANFMTTSLTQTVLKLTSLLPNAARSSAHQSIPILRPAESSETTAPIRGKS